MYYLVNRERKLSTESNNIIWACVDCIGITDDLEIAEEETERMNGFITDDNFRYVTENVSKIM